MAVPPGFLYIAQNLPRFFLPPGATFAVLRILRDQHHIDLSTWLEIVACILSLPVAFVANNLYWSWRNARDAAARGAVLAPKAKARLPGAIDRLLDTAKLFATGYIGEAFDQQARVHGNTVNVHVLWEDRVMTTEPEYIKAILASQFNSFAKGPELFEQNKTLLGTGVFNSDGDTWKFHRSMTRPFFSKDRIGHFDIFDRHADDALSRTALRLAEGLPVDIQDMVSRFTLDSATEFLFGKDVCSLSAGLVYPPNHPLADSYEAKNDPANQFAHAFAEAQIGTASRSIWGRAWRLREFWTDDVQKNINVCFRFINPILDDALARKEAGKVGIQQEGSREVQEGESLLDHLINLTDDRKLIGDEILNIMIAGRDTTACTLTMAVYMLSQHPDVLARLREETLDQVGPTNRPTYDDLREMKYMRAFVNEVLRLYPPVPGNARYSTQPTVWPGLNGKPPIYIPANTRTPYSVFLMHRRKDLWGPDADNFDPDRFLDERQKKYLTPNPFIFLPFNAGPRICLGQQFAYNEASFFLVRLLQRFSAVQLAEDVQTMPPPEWASAEGRKAVERVMVKTHLTMYVKDGLWVRMDEAKGEA
ncbi:cytochrome P450 monooxygenase pc-3 [Coniophora puteana RWD-64-598 SS2]|uniref:Cytochrome P450 monooxygenase pc-3 n=1 Tax=Coniophora puteana (strain RWD-64-598) TaxID=741705 RepID=A0A5M3MS35_CONPW|nr:cytochrome P450 monooxygenase pc-3 [Coniophora puteana RWD-64-598 SS2]EIW81963.1 cytochrome P450 monooxygenase pc-3 [Coniophora puteana RWD-64-598 SS2]